MITKVSALEDLAAQVKNKIQDALAQSFKFPGDMPIGESSKNEDFGEMK